MACQTCQSPRILSVFAHSVDRNSFTIQGKEQEGYVPDDLGIGRGDDVEFRLCLNCGQQQGTWPLPKSDLEEQ